MYTYIMSMCKCPYRDEFDVVPAVGREEVVQCQRHGPALPIRVLQHCTQTFRWKARVRQRPRPFPRGACTCRKHIPSEAL
jgi:hypothetical protein